MLTQYNVYAMGKTLTPKNFWLRLQIFADRLQAFQATLNCNFFSKRVGTCRSIGNYADDSEVKTTHSNDLLKLPIFYTSCAASERKL